MSSRSTHSSRLLQLRCFCGARPYTAASSRYYYGTRHRIRPLSVHTATNTGLTKRHPIIRPGPSGVQGMESSTGLGDGDGPAAGETVAGGGGDGPGAAPPVERESKRVTVLLVLVAIVLASVVVQSRIAHSRESPRVIPTPQRRDPGYAATVGRPTGVAGAPAARLPAPASQRGKDAPRPPAGEQVHAALPTPAEALPPPPPLPEHKLPIALVQDAPKAGSDEWYELVGNRFVTYHAKYGRLNNRRFGMVGALGVARMLGRTLIVPDHLHTYEHRPYRMIELHAATFRAVTPWITQGEFRQYIKPRLKLTKKDIIVHTREASRPWWPPVLGLGVSARDVASMRKFNFGLDEAGLVQLRALVGIKVIVSTELHHTATYTDWLVPGTPLGRKVCSWRPTGRPASTEGAEGNEEEEAGPPEVPTVPCATAYVRSPPWVEKMSADFLQANPGPYVRFVAVHFRGMGTTKFCFNYAKGRPPCASGVDCSAYAEPCCSPRADVMLQRMKGLGISPQTHKLFLMVDGHPRMADGIAHLRKAFASRLLTIPGSMIASAPAKPKLAPNNVAVLLEMYIAEKADVFIGSRYSSVSYWVSNNRGKNGVLDTTYTFCDNVPISWSAAWPNALPSPSAVASGFNCSSWESSPLRKPDGNAFSQCWFQRNPWLENSRKERLPSPEALDTALGYSHLERTVL